MPLTKPMIKRSKCQLHPFIAACLRQSRQTRVTLLDGVNRTTIATFDAPSLHQVHTMTFLPDNSQLVLQSDQGIFLSLSLINDTTEGPMLKHLILLPDIPLWHGA